MASSPRRGRQQTSKRAQVEQRVLAATEGLLAEGNTYPELSVEKIATRAGLGRTGFYFYFSDKQDVLMRLTEGVAQQLYEEAQRWWEGEIGDEETLADALRGTLRLYGEYPLLVRAVVDAASTDPEMGEMWRAVIGRFIEATTDRLKREQEAGHAVGLDPVATSTALVWMVERTTYQRIAQGENTDDPAFLQSLVDIWTRVVYGRVDGS
jgi:AcrR family transcriptional regulator